jgi:hypothetical protein
MATHAACYELIARLEALRLEFRMLSKSTPSPPGFKTVLKALRVQPRVWEFFVNGLGDEHQQQRLKDLFRAYAREAAILAGEGKDREHAWIDWLEMLHSHSGSFHIDDVVEATIDRLKDVASYKVETKAAPAAPIPMEISTPEAEAMAVVSISAEPPTAAGEQENLAQESAATVIPTLPAATHIPYLKQAGGTEPGAPAESASPVPVSAESPAAARLAEIPAEPLTVEASAQTTPPDDLPQATDPVPPLSAADVPGPKPRKQRSLRINGPRLMELRLETGLSKTAFRRKLGSSMSKTTYDRAENSERIDMTKVHLLVDDLNALLRRKDDNRLTVGDLTLPD